MASSAVDLGTGAVLVFSGFTYEITAMSISGLSREAIDTTNLATTANGVGSKTYIGGDLSDPGELSVEGHFNPDDSPPIEGASGVGTITFAETATWAASMFLTAFDFDIPLEEKMTFTATFKLTGQITIVAAI